MHLDSTVVLPGWRRAYEAVWSLFPATRAHITPTRSCITPGAILEYAELSGIAVGSGVIPRWEEHDWGRPRIYSKMDLFDRVFANASIQAGEVILITDDCFPVTAREPFFCRGESLREFVAACPHFVFDGDVVFIWPVARRISVFHHEGTFAHIDCHDHAA